MNKYHLEGEIKTRGGWQNGNKRKGVDVCKGHGGHGRNLKKGEGLRQGCQGAAVEADEGK